MVFFTTLKQPNHQFQRTPAGAAEQSRWDLLRMYRQILVLIAICLAATSASAQYTKVEGEFRSATTTLSLIPLDSEAGVIAASTNVTLGACSGTVVGVGKMSGSELKFSPYVKADKSDACVVKVVFDKKFNSASISAANCVAHSGASCGWEGENIKRVK